MVTWCRDIRTSSDTHMYMYIYVYTLRKRVYIRLNYGSILNWSGIVQVARFESRPETIQWLLTAPRELVIINVLCVR